MSPPFLLRPATPDDAPAIAHVHVTSWQETYAGLMPEEFLTRMTDETARARREAFWARQLAEETGEVVLVAEQGAGVVAFASGGPARDHPGFDAEVSTLYALRGVQGRGVGRALLLALGQALRERGHRSLALWVLDTNPTRQWYGRQGGREVGEKVEPLPGGGELREVRMVWESLSQLR